MLTKNFRVLLQEEARQLRLSQVRKELTAVSIGINPCIKGCQHDKVEVAWNSAAYHIMRNYQCSSPVRKQLRDRLELEESGIKSCEGCITWLSTRVAKLDQELTTELKVIH